MPLLWTFLIGSFGNLINLFILSGFSHFLIKKNTKNIFKAVWIFGFSIRLIIYGIIVILCIFFKNTFNIYILFIIFSIPTIVMISLLFIEKEKHNKNK